MLNSESIIRAQIPVAPTLVCCEIHKDEEIKLFCKNCNDLICSECIVDQHVGHTFLSLKDKVGETRKNVPRIVETIKNNTIPEVRETLKKITQTLKEHSENGTTVVNSINGQADELIKETNKARNKLIQEEETRQSTDRMKLKEFEKKTEEILSNAEKLITDCPDKIKTAKDSSIIKLGLDLDKNISEIEKQAVEKIPSFELRIFVPGKRSTESIKDFRDLLGQCVDKKHYRTDGSSNTLERKSNQVTLTEMEIHSKLRHDKDLNNILAIATQDNHTAWIATYASKTIKHVNLTGQVNKTLTFNTEIWDIAVTGDGGLILTPNSGSLDDERWYKIKKVKPNGAIVTFLNMKPLIPRGSCITKTGHIYVGCMESFDYDITERSTRAVMKLSSTGVVQQSYQYDSKHRMLFTAPLRIQENINGDLWIRDSTAPFAGRVVVLQQDGKLRFLYAGVQNDQLTKPFHPCGLTAVGDGTVLVTDARNDTIHVVDKSGTILRFLGSKHVVYPISISLDRKNSQLWIGAKNGQVQVFHFK